MDYAEEKCQSSDVTGELLYQVVDALVGIICIIENLNVRLRETIQQGKQQAGTLRAKLLITLKSKRK